MSSNNRTVKIVDETIREGMQHSGIVFTYLQRKKILEFQEKLGVDISETGYPPAHSTEAHNVKKLYRYASDNDHKIQVAGMGRALLKDAKTLIKTGINHFHLHARIDPDKDKDGIKVLSDIKRAVEYIKDKRTGAKISIAMLDIGKTAPLIIEQYSDFLIHKLKIDILSMPDTSGIMAPNFMYDRIKPIADMATGQKTHISIHCHNDMGMASANTIMGVYAGGHFFEASALGIGERNGIADIFTTGKILKDQGFKMNLKTNETVLFREYYEYINDICRKQTGESLLNANTPFFGDAVKTHVAGTHGAAEFGIGGKEKFFLNLLCGKHLVEKYLKAADIGYNMEKADIITEKIKSQSAFLQRRLTEKEIKHIAKQA